MSVNRFVCSVLEEMRTAHRLYRMDLIPGLIEEVQTLVNRMEAKLADYSEMGYDLEEHQKNKKRMKEIDRMCDKWEERLETVSTSVEFIGEEEDEPDTPEPTPEMVEDYRITAHKVARKEIDQEIGESWDRVHTWNKPITCWPGRRLEEME